MSVIEVVDPMDEFLSDEMGAEDTATPAESDSEPVEDGETGTDPEPEPGEPDPVDPSEPETPAEEAPAEVPATSTADKASEQAGLMAALMAEREKRQAAERKLAEKPKEPLKFDWDNPEATIEAVREEMRQENQTRLLDMSEAGARARHEDYGEKYEVFVAMAKENPALVQAMLAKPDPAEYVYQTATQRIFHDEVGADPKAYEDKLRAKIRQEVEAEFSTKADSKKALADSLPPSANSLTDKNTPVDTIKDPYDDLFPGQHRS